MTGFYSRPCYIKSGKIDYNTFSCVQQVEGGFDILVNDELRHITGITQEIVEAAYEKRVSEIETIRYHFFRSMLQIANLIADQLNAMFYLKEGYYLYLSPFPTDTGVQSISFALPPTDKRQYDLSSIFCLTEDTGATIVSSSLIESDPLDWTQIRNYDTTSFYTRIDDLSFPSVLVELVSASSAGIISSFRYDQGRNFVIRNSYDGKDVYVKYGQYLVKKYYINNEDYLDANDKNRYLVYYGATKEQIENLERIV